MGLAGGDAAPRYVTDVDVAGGTVTVGREHDLYTDHVGVRALTWAHEPPIGPVVVQCSAHGDVHAAMFDPTERVVRWAEPRRRVAPGQAVVLYDGDEVVGGGIAT